MSENEMMKFRKEMEEEVEKLIESSPKVFARNSNNQLFKYQGFWYYIYNYPILKYVILFQKNFVARDTDILISSLPKTGTTWLKSLLFSIVNRKNHPSSESPLLHHHPQELVYGLETDVYNELSKYPRPHHLDELTPPRLFSTHVAYTSLPESIKTSKCRIVYICRNPFDTLVSSYHFYLSLQKNSEKGGLVTRSFEDVFEDFCEGKSLFGPFFDHVLEYWNASLEQPDKVMFLKYEDLKDDPTLHLKKIAKFIGLPFSPEEEESEEGEEGVIKEIIDFCSIKNMKELEVIKSGVIINFFEKKSFYRKGEVGDWTNHFTPSMVERMTKLMDEKLQGTGLSFKLLPS